MLSTPYVGSFKQTPYAGGGCPAASSTLKPKWAKKQEIDLMRVEHLLTLERIAAMLAEGPSDSAAFISEVRDFVANSRKLMEHDAKQLQAQEAAARVAEEEKMALQVQMEQMAMEKDLLTDQLEHVTEKLLVAEEIATELELKKELGSEDLVPSADESTYNYEKYKERYGSMFPSDDDWLNEIDGTDVETPGRRHTMPTSSFVTPQSAGTIHFGLLVPPASVGGASPAAGDAASSLVWDMEELQTAIHGPSAAAVVSPTLPSGDSGVAVSPFESSGGTPVQDGQQQVVMETAKRVNWQLDEREAVEQSDILESLNNAQSFRKEFVSKAFHPDVTGCASGASEVAGNASLEATMGDLEDAVVNILDTLEETEQQEVASTVEEMQSFRRQFVNKAFFPDVPPPSSRRRGSLSSPIQPAKTPPPTGLTPEQAAVRRRLQFAPTPSPASCPATALRPKAPMSMHRATPSGPPALQEGDPNNEVVASEEYRLVRFHCQPLEGENLFTSFQNAG